MVEGLRGRGDRFGLSGGRGDRFGLSGGRGCFWVGGGGALCGPLLDRTLEGRRKEKADVTSAARLLYTVE